MVVQREWTNSNQEQKLFVLVGIGRHVTNPRDVLVSLQDEGNVLRIECPRGEIMSNTDLLKDMLDSNDVMEQVDILLLMQEMEGELKRLRNHRSDQVYDVAYVQVCKQANASKPPSTHKMLGSKYDNSQGLLLVYDVLTELDDYAVETFSDDEVIFG